MKLTFCFVKILKNKLQLGASRISHRLLIWVIYKGHFFEMFTLNQAMLIALYKPEVPFFISSLVNEKS